ncbi:MAG TPA: RagB/SusD family nutrient uptake outer membrane protein [Chitinophagaceae bacterium]|nr:RagB/SusD family nutrient uptake outer membrane protein [Chitinophagaceae bacterium]
MKKIKIFSIVLVLFALGISCKKDYLETRPSDAVTQEEILGTTDKISSTLDAAYKTFFAFSPSGGGGHDDYGQKSWDLSSDLMGTDMVVHTAGYGWYNASYQYTEWQVPTANRHSDLAWFYYYNLIKQANTILKVIDGVSGSQTDKEKFKGEALGMRAYAYYFLINYYQQTYKGNENKPGVIIQLDPGDFEGKTRTSVQAVYDQIIADLTQAESLLSGKTRVDKVHIDVSVVRGLRARVALLMEDWPTAAAKANLARQGYALMSAATYPTRSAFSSINNSEWMWGSFIPSDQSTIYASFFSHIDITNQGYAFLGSQKKITKALYDQIPAGDVRKDVFMPPGTGTANNPDYNQLKFQVPVANNWGADYLYMRSAEMYLIEAEALARQSQDAPARALLETMVQARYPAYSAASFSGAALINEILLQRRIELWGEGFSLIDIKRLKIGLNRPTGPGNHGSPNFDPSVYILPAGDPKFLMRIPQKELDSNPALTPADQNP